MPDKSAKKNLTQLNAQLAADCTDFTVTIANDENLLVSWTQTLSFCGLNGMISAGSLPNSFTITLAQDHGSLIEIDVFSGTPPTQTAYVIAVPKSGAGRENFKVSQIIAAGNGNGQLPDGFQVTKG